MYQSKKSGAELLTRIDQDRRFQRKCIDLARAIIVCIREKVEWAGLAVLSHREVT